MSSDLDEIKFTNRQKGVFAVFVATIAIIVYGSLKLKFDIPEMSAVYIAVGIIGGSIAGYDAKKISETFMDGGKSIFVGEMAVGVARGISVVMENTNIVARIQSNNHKLANICGTINIKFSYTIRKRLCDGIYACYASFR